MVLQKFFSFNKSASSGGLGSGSRYSNFTDDYTNDYTNDYSNDYTNDDDGDNDTIGSENTKSILRRRNAKRNTDRNVSWSRTFDTYQEGRVGQYYDNQGQQLRVDDVDVDDLVDMVDTFDTIDTYDQNDAMARLASIQESRQDSNTKSSSTSFDTNTYGSNTFGSNTFDSNTFGSNTIGSDTFASNTVGSSSMRDVSYTYSDDTRQTYESGTVQHGDDSVSVTSETEGAVEMFVQNKKAHSPMPLLPPPPPRMEAPRQMKRKQLAPPQMVPHQQYQYPVTENRQPPPPPMNMMEPPRQVERKQLTNTMGAQQQYHPQWGYQQAPQLMMMPPQNQSQFHNNLASLSNVSADTFELMQDRYGGVDGGEEGNQENDMQVGNVIATNQAVVQQQKRQAEKTPTPSLLSTSQEKVQDTKQKAPKISSTPNDEKVKETKQKEMNVASPSSEEKVKETMQQENEDTSDTLNKTTPTKGKKNKLTKMVSKVFKASKEAISKSFTDEEGQEGGVASVIGTIFVGDENRQDNVYSQREATEFTFMAEREAVMNGEIGDGDDDNNMEGQEKDASPEMPAETEEASTPLLTTKEEEPQATPAKEKAPMSKMVSKVFKSSRTSVTRSSPVQEEQEKDASEPPAKEEKASVPTAGDEEKKAALKPSPIFIPKELKLPKQVELAFSSSGSLGSLSMEELNDDTLFENFDDNQDVNRKHAGNNHGHEEYYQPRRAASDDESITSLTKKHEDYNAMFKKQQDADKTGAHIGLILPFWNSAVDSVINLPKTWEDAEQLKNDWLKGVEKSVAALTSPIMQSKALAEVMGESKSSTHSSAFFSNDTSNTSEDSVGDTTKGAEGKDLTKSIESSNQVKENDSADNNEACKASLSIRDLDMTCAADAAKGKGTRSLIDNTSTDEEEEGAELSQNEEEEVEAEDVPSASSDGESDDSFLVREQGEVIELQKLGKKFTVSSTKNKIELRNKLKHAIKRKKKSKQKNVIYDELLPPEIIGWNEDNDANHSTNNSNVKKNKLGILSWGRKKSKKKTEKVSSNGNKNSNNGGATSNKISDRFVPNFLPMGRVYEDQDDDVSISSCVTTESILTELKLIEDTAKIMYQQMMAKVNTEDVLGSNNNISALWDLGPEDESELVLEDGDKRKYSSVDPMTITCGAVQFETGEFQEVQEDDEKENSLLEGEGQTAPGKKSRKSKFFKIKAKKTGSVSATWTPS